VRIYLPATSNTLRQLLETRQLPPPQTAFALTPGLREWYAEGDDEELEYAATAEAARAALRLLNGDEQAARRRVVLAVDVPNETVEVRDDIDRGVVRTRQAVPLADIAAVLADDADAEATVAAAARVVDRADLGDDEAQDAVDDAEGFELSWYATQEIPDLLAGAG
jgi:hypothetical protein